MARFERSRGKGKRESRDRPPRDDVDSGEPRRFEDYAKGKKSFGGRSSRRDSRRGRDSGRGSKRFDRERSDLEMTKVTCSACGVECEVPFKPRTNKPLFCRECFGKKDRDSGSSKDSNNKDLEIINKKLDKIMEALDIK